MKDVWQPLAQGVPVFFLSYARNRDRTSSTSEDPGSDDNVLRFYQDLCLHVRQLVGSRTGTVPGFIDQSMSAGSEWHPRLLHALMNAPVFVALLSADYVDSPWCGMEWDAFSRRRPVRVDGHETNYESTVLPVIWSPLARRRVPSVVHAVQRFAPAIQAEAELRRTYLQNGIYGLLAIESPYYGAVVWHLARLISDLFHAFCVPPGGPLDADQLCNAFERNA